MENKTAITSTPEPSTSPRLIEQTDSSIKKPNKIAPKPQSSETSAQSNQTLLPANRGITSEMIFERQVPKQPVHPEHDLGVELPKFPKRGESGDYLERFGEEVISKISQMKKLTDPGEGQTLPEEVLASERISNSVVTPFDWSEIVQTLQNPIAPAEIISVQIVQRNIKPTHQFTEPFDAKDLTKTCPQNHLLEYGTSVVTLDPGTNEIKSNNLCDFCGSEELYSKSAPNNLYWRCTGCEGKPSSFDGVCKNCYTSHFVRRKLEAKTSLHHSYENYKITPNTENVKNSREALERAIASQNLGDLEDETANLTSQDDIGINSFATCTMEEPSANDGKDVSVYAFIGLWRGKPEEMVCYRNFRVDNPIFLTKHKNFSDDLHMHAQEFLHVAANRKDIYYFCSDHNQAAGSEVRLNVIDLQSACDSKSESKMQEYSQNVFEPPLQQAKSHVLRGLVRELVLHNFNLTAEEPNPKFVRTVPVLTDGYLVVTTDKAIQQSSGPDYVVKHEAVVPSQASGQNLSGTLEKTVYECLHLCNLQSQEVCFVIYKVSVFIQLETLQDGLYIWALAHISKDLFSLLKFKVEELTEYPAKVQPVKAPANKNVTTYKFVESLTNASQQKLETKALDTTLVAHWNLCKKKGAVEAFMHLGNKRCTLLFQNQDWFTFELREDMNAVKILEHPKTMQDCTLLRKPSGMFIVGNLRKYDIKQKKDARLAKAYLPWLLSVYDINEDPSRTSSAPTLVPSRSVKNLQEKELSYAPCTDYKINISADVKYAKDGHQTSEAIYKLSVMATAQEEILPVVIFYQSDDQQRTNVCSVLGIKPSAKKTSNLGLQRFKTIKQFPKSAPQIIEQVNYTLNYPLIMYLTPHPIRNRLVVVNTAMDVPQVMINIYPYRWVCFVTAGMQDFNQVTEPGESAIYFLAQHTEKQTFRLLCYRTNPWRADNDPDSGNFPLSRQHNFLLVSGQVCLPEDLLFSPIKQAILIQKQTQTGTQMSIIFQYHSSKGGVQACFFGGKKPINLIDDNQDLQSLLMLCGANNTAYFVCFDQQLGYQIQCVSYKSTYADPTCHAVYSQRSAILAMQIKHEEHIGENELSQVGIYILDESSRYQLLTQNKTRINAKQLAQDVVQSTYLNVTSIIDLAERGQKIDELVSQLYVQQFPCIVMGARTLVIPHQKLEEGRTVEQTGYNLKSHTNFTQDYLGYNADTNLFVKSTQTKQINQDCVVLHMQQVPWIGKHLSVVRESNRSYFRMYKSPELKRTDLMNYTDSNTYAQQVETLDAVILLSVKDYCLVFDRSNQLLKSKLKQWKAKIRTKMYNNRQYVEHKQEKKGKDAATNDIYKYSSDGTSRVVRYSFQNLEQNIWKELGNQFKVMCEEMKLPFKITMPHERPDSLITKDGRIVQVVLLNQTDSQGDYQFPKKTREEFLTQKLPILVNIYKRTDATDENNQKLADGVPAEDDNISEYYMLVGDIFRVLLPPYRTFRDSQKYMSYHLTDEYLVLVCIDVIFSIRLDDIKSANSNKNYIKNLYGPPQIPVKLIQMRKLFDPDDIDGGVLVTNVTPGNLQIVESIKKRTNVIQISTLNHLLMWDIDADEEVTCLKGYSQFCTVDSFVRTGLQFYIPTKLNTKQALTMKDVQHVTNNGDYTMFCMPGGQTGTCFKLFCDLDLYEMIALQDRIKKSQLLSTTMIDENTVLTDVYGVTIFQLLDSVQVVDIIKEQIQKANLEPFNDKKGLEYDNIFIRQLFQILKLPFVWPKGMSNLAQAHNQDKVINVMYDQIRGGGSPGDTGRRDFEAKIFISNFLRKFNSLEPQEGVRKNLVQTCLFEEQGVDSDMLEPLVDLLLMSRESSLSNVITTFDDFKRLFDISSAVINNFLQRSFISTEMSSAVTNIPWDARESVLVFGSQTSQYSEETIKKNIFLEKIAEKQHFTARVRSFLQRIFWLKPSIIKQRPVEVRILEVAWLNKNVKGLFQYLKGIQDENMFDNELVKVLLIKQNYSSQLVLKVLFPYIIYMITVILYFTYVLTGSETDRDHQFFQGPWQNVFCRSIILVFTIVWLGVEVAQAMSLGRAYFSDKYNVLAVASYCTNLAVVAVHASNLEYNPLRLTQLASVAVLILWVSIFYWMRLFEQTAFYVLMITETSNDIKYFMVMLFLCIATFANAILIIDLKQTVMNSDAIAANVPDTEEYAPLIDTKLMLNNSAIDAWLNQYLLGLGEFSLDPFLVESEQNSKYLIWSYFLLATLITNITFLNVLIAIISDTYARITEAKERYALMQRTQIYADFISVVNLNPRMTSSRFLYVVTPVDINEEGQDWAGSINALKKMVARNQTKTEEMIVVENRALKKDISIMQNQLDKVGDNVESIQDQLTTLIQNIQAMAQAPK